MACYCANFYGSINCHNQVTRFGDRCKLCIALKSGASMSSGLLSSDSDRDYKLPRSSSNRPHHHHAADPQPYGNGSSSGSSGSSSKPARPEARYSRK